MNCLYITLFSNIVAGIVQTFIKSWNQLLYPGIIEACRLSFETRHAFFLRMAHCSDLCLDSVAKACTADIYSYIACTADIYSYIACTADIHSYIACTADIYIYIACTTYIYLA